MRLQHRAQLQLLKDRAAAHLSRPDSPAMTLGSPLVSPGFARCLCRPIGASESGARRGVIQITVVPLSPNLLS
jgi:hypothetical protein